MPRKLLMVAALTVAYLATGLPAAAHVTVQPPEAPAGSFFRMVVRVPNERDDAATTKVEVQFPPNVTFVSFQPNGGWDRQVTMVTLDEPVEVFGEQISEVVGTVTWEGGEIRPGEFEEFAFSWRVPDETTTLAFPAIQTYDSGEVVRWVGPPDSQEPAARVEVVELPAGEDEGQLALLVAAAAKAQAAATRGWIGVGLGALAFLLGGAALASPSLAADPAWAGVCRRGAHYHVPSTGTGSRRGSVHQQFLSS